MRNNVFIKKILTVVLFISIMFSFICNTNVYQAKSIPISKAKKLYMYVGTSVKIKVKKYKISSTNKKIVTVSKKGNVKAKKAGNAKLIIKKNKKIKQRCSIKVGMRAKSLNIKGAASVFLKAGQTYTINSEITPKKVLYKKVTYTVADSSIASVNANGVITPLKDGITQVTVTTKATNKNNKNLSKSITVIVQMTNTDNEPTNPPDLGDELSTQSRPPVVIIPPFIPTMKPTEEPTQAPTEEPTQVPTEEPTEKPTQVPTQNPTAEPGATAAVTTTPTPTKAPTPAPTKAPTPTPTKTPTATPVPTVQPTPTPFDINEYIASLVPDPDNPLVTSFVVANDAGQLRTIYLLNKSYEGNISVLFDGYYYSKDASVYDVLRKLQTETGSVTNSAGTVKVGRTKRTESWKLTFLETGKSYYFTGKINDTLYKSQFGIMIAEGNTLENIVIKGR